MYANYKIKYVNYCERNLLFVKLYIFELIKTKLYYTLNGWILQKAKKKRYKGFANYSSKTIRNIILIKRRAKNNKT